MTTVLLAVDERYLQYVPCLLIQLGKFGRCADGVTLVVPTHVAAGELAAVTAVAASEGLVVEVVTISEVDTLHAGGVLPDGPGDSHLTHFAFSKLLLAERLTHLDDVLYLDVDIVIRQPLDDLLSWELRHPLGAVPDLGAVKRLGGGWGTAAAPYFNSGVMRMSLGRIREEGIWDRTLRIVNEHAPLDYLDQDVLNIIFRGRFDVLPPAFNVLDRYYEQCKGLTPWQNPAIVHFSGKLKPWHRSASSPFAREWRRHHARSTAVIGAVGEIGEGPPPAARRSGVTGFARRVLPGPLKRSARSASVRVLDRVLCRLDEIKTAIEGGTPTAMKELP